MPEIAGSFGGPYPVTTKYKYVALLCFTPVLIVDIRWESYSLEDAKLYASEKITGTPLNVTPKAQT